LHILSFCKTQTNYPTLQYGIGGRLTFIMMFWLSIWLVLVAPLNSQKDNKSITKKIKIMTNLKTFIAAFTTALLFFVFIVF
jgi:hypothetical protein